MLSKYRKHGGLSLVENIVFVIVENIVLIVSG